MSANESRTIADVFNLLDRWRHLPAYRLESRVAPFFALFLRDVLSARFGVELHNVVIPEFPLRIGTLYPEGKSPPNRSEEKRQSWRNLSYNVDYVAFSKDRNSKDRKMAFLVELKTDMDSLRESQSQYLLDTRRVGLKALVKGVIEIWEATKKKEKYGHLLYLLSKLGLVSPPSSRNGNLRNAFDGVQATVDKQDWEIKIVYIQPTEKPDFEYIYFDEVADVVQERGELGCIFANYLRQWTAEAGSRDPRGMANNM